MLLNVTQLAIAEREAPNYWDISDIAKPIGVAVKLG